MTKPVVLAPISEILIAYWKSDRWMLLVLAVVGGER
jgi:ATP-binding cassette, subfamily B, bacterial